MLVPADFLFLPADSQSITPNSYGAKLPHNDATLSKITEMLPQERLFGRLYLSDFFACMASMSSTLCLNPMPIVSVASEVMINADGSIDFAIVLMA